MYNKLIEINQKVHNGQIPDILDKDIINKMTMSLLEKQNHTEKDIMIMGIIINISNILYDNTSNDMILLDHGVYDLILELYKKYNPLFQVGSEPVMFLNETSKSIINKKKIENPFLRIDEDKVQDFLYNEELQNQPVFNRMDMLKYPFKRDMNINYISRRSVSTDIKHAYPELVGSLDKCKFVLNKQAIDKGVFNDTNVLVLERDFFAKHISDGIIQPSQVFKMALELKYDGVSVEAEVSNRIISARTRGDANKDIAADITPILAQYVFPQAYNKISPDDVFGMKFEAIMTYSDLYKYNKLRGKDYKNCRTAISSIFTSSDGWKYVDLITLVPLSTSLDIDRITEIEFMNRYYRKNELLRYAIIEGDYVNCLYSIKVFVEESEYMRIYMPFMYDGVVVSYLDEDLRYKLGRKNSINKYSMAIKFNTLKKLTIFRGYTFTIGQDGSITPMIHYDPVEFYGTIHTKSSGHSFDNFKKLGLRYGDIIEVEYVNDVMPYVTKPDNSYNASNQQPQFMFIEHCPSCGCQLVVSDSGKSVFCVNIECPERNLKRITSMMQKLNLKDFSEAYISQIAKYSLTELLSLTVDDVAFLGEVNSHKFIERMNEIKTRKIYDYEILGSLGFSNISIQKWKLILEKYSLNDILMMDINTMKNLLSHIKGVGPITSQIIADEFEFFRTDLITINNMNNIVISKGLKKGKTIRFTGFRNLELMQFLNSNGHDAREGAVTSKTDILLVPSQDYTSSKTEQAVNKGIQIVPINEFEQNMKLYLE